MVMSNDKNEPTTSRHGATDSEKCFESDRLPTHMTNLAKFESKKYPNEPNPFKTPRNQTQT